MAALDRRKSEKQRNYGYEQLELLRILIEKGNCSADMIHALTGVPQGSLGYIRKTLNIPAARASSLFPTPNENINNARRVAILRRRYAGQIARLFPQDNRPIETEFEGS